MMDQNILDTKKKPVSELIGDYDIAVITARDAPMGVESVPRSPGIHESLHVGEENQ